MDFIKKDSRIHGRFPGQICKPTCDSKLNAGSSNETKFFHKRNFKLKTEQNKMIMPSFNPQS